MCAPVYGRSLLYVSRVVHESSADLGAGYASNKKMDFVPWKAVKASGVACIEPEYLPNGFELRDPSRLTKEECELVLQHWENRAAMGLQPVEFSHWVDRDQKVHLARSLPSERSSHRNGESEPRKRKVSSVAMGKKKQTANKRRRQGVVGAKGTDNSTEESAENDEKNTDGESSEDFGSALNAIRDEEESPGPSRSKRQGDTRPNAKNMNVVRRYLGTSPADVKDAGEIEKIKYLKSLSEHNEYRRMINCILLQEVSELHQG